MRRLIGLALAFALLAGCGAPATPEAAKPSLGDGYNSTDIMFAQMMVLQQDPAVKMLEVAAKRAKNPEVKTLVAAIQVTQADEVNTIKGWLDKWQQSHTPDTVGGEHAAHGGLPSNGEAELAAMSAASDADFDKTFMNIFIGHQHQSVEVARMEMTAGINHDAVELAKRVDASRRGEIEMMLKLVA